jgi:lipid-binding SYLF domain-containing protein
VKLFRWITTGVALLAFGMTSALAAPDKAKQQEVLKTAQSALADFYKADAKIKGEVEKAPGYAVFTTYGLSFLLGGAGGKGVVHDNQTKKYTYMDMALASAGLQIGAAQTRYLFIFKDKAQMQQFIDKGWEASANITGGAGTGKQTDGGSLGAFTGGKFYQLTKTGLEVGAAAQGTKVWKDKDLN